MFSVGFAAYSATATSAINSFVVVVVGTDCCCVESLRHESSRDLRLFGCLFGLLLGSV